jgi:N1-aminopropylagmatine ureohydrolase
MSPMVKTLGIRSNFLGIEEEYSSFAASRVVILPVPYEQTVSYGVGTKLGPGAILKASHQVEFYDEETGREVYKQLGIATLPPLPVGGKTDEAALGLIHERVRGLLDEKKLLITLGGEHTISQSIIAAYADRYRDLSVVQIDAHSDLRPEYQGNKYSHASVMARVCEFLDARRLVQVGIRAQTREEARFIREKGITTLYAHEIRDGKYDRILKLWDDHALEKLSRHVYVTFDVDGLDPSIMPATGTPEPNGLLWNETMRFLRNLGKNRTVVGCDVVEFSPIKGFHFPDLTAARLVSKMINYFWR